MSFFGLSMSVSGGWTLAQDALCRRWKFHFFGSLDSCCHLVERATADSILSGLLRHAVSLGSEGQMSGRPASGLCL